MGYLIDSSVVIDFERHVAQRKPWAPEEKFWQMRGALAAVTVAEMLHGVERAQIAQRRAWRSRFVETLILQLPVLPYTLEVAREHARLWADLLALGVPIGDHDTQIAATALTHDLTLWTLNERHFARVDRLRWVSTA